MKKILSILLASLALVACSSNQAKVTIKTPDQVKQDLEKNMPNLPKIESISQSPVAGLYQIVVDRNVYYVTNDAKTLVVGNMIDVATKTNYTEQAAQDLNKIDWSSLPLDKALKIVKGNGSRSFAVFSDPQCPYCVKFEQEVIDKLDNVTIYLYIFPLPFHEKAIPYSKEILCSADPVKAWTSWSTTQKGLLGTEAAVKKACSADALAKAETTLAEMKKVGDMVRVTGTPTIVFTNGKIIPGALPLAQFTKVLEEVAATSSK